MKIVLTGGGTGGHAFPALSIAETLRAEHPDWQVLYLGSRSGPEAHLARKSGIPFQGLTSRKLVKVLSPGTLLTIGALGKGFVEAAAVLNRFKPDLVIGTGGYVAAAVILAQGMRRGKTVIHEQNVVPGRTNRWLSRFASRICVTFEDSLRFFPERKALVTGLPIRMAFHNPPDRHAARKALGLEEDVFTVLVLGGSQGARAINDVILESAPTLSKMPLQIFHQAGQRNVEQVEQRSKLLDWKRYHVRAFIDDIVQAYAAADLVVGRSGASTIAEITAMGLPSILVPYPYAYADHQRSNAEFVARGGGALMILESEFTPQKLCAEIKRLLASVKDLEQMASKSRSLGRPNAAHQLLAAAIRELETPVEPRFDMRNQRH